jgi:hypothetical protein
MSKVDKIILDNLFDDDGKIMYRLTVYLDLNTVNAQRKHIEFKAENLSIRELGPALMMLAQSLMEEDTEANNEMIKARQENLR